MSAYRYSLVSKPYNKLFAFVLYFYILVDNEIMDIDEGQRQDKLLERIYDIFSDSRDYGMGELRIGGLSELWEQNNKFGGYQLMMRVYDFK